MGIPGQNASNAAAVLVRSNPHPQGGVTLREAHLEGVLPCFIISGTQQGAWTTQSSQYRFDYRLKGRKAQRREGQRKAGREEEK